MSTSDTETLKLINDHLESALFLAQGIKPPTPHSLHMVNDLQRAFDNIVKLYTQAEERAAKGRAA